MSRIIVTQIVAHRGASVEAPENTVEAFEKAIQIGSDMIEFDVRRAANGKLVISHDPIREPSPNVPTLEETLRLAEGRIRLDVELKEPDCEADVIRLLRKYFPVHEFCITSFLAPVLRKVRGIDATIRTGLIFAVWNDNVPTACDNGDVDLLVAHRSIVDEAEKLAKPLFVWTVDDPEFTRELFRHPLVEAIVTNNPRQAIALRSAAA